MRLLFEVHGVVRAPVEGVRERMCSATPASPGRTGSSTANTASSPTGATGGTAARTRRTPPRGRADRARVYDIAKQGNWAPHLANKLFIGYRARLEATMRQRVAQLEAQS